jgi:DNA sulfur modification protein DndB
MSGIQPRLKGVVNMPDLKKARYLIKKSFEPDQLIFAAVLGKQGKHRTFGVQMGLRQLARLFKADDHGDPLLRSQRIVNAARAKKVTSYISRRSSNYVLPALTATIEDVSVKFPRACCSNSDLFKTWVTPMDGDLEGSVGLLSIPETSRLWFIDGQTRATGIKGLLALVGSSPLCERILDGDTVLVQLRMDTGIEERQAHFSDINESMTKVSGSLNAIYSQGKSINSSITASCIRRSFPFGKVDYEKNTCAGKSNKLWAYKALFDASMPILESLDESMKVSEKTEIMLDFWSGYLSCKDLALSDPVSQRNFSLVTYGVFVVAYSQAFMELCSQNRQHCLVEMVKENSFDKSFEIFEGVCVRDGRVFKSAKAVKMLADHLVGLCDL